MDRSRRYSHCCLTKHNHSLPLFKSSQISIKDSSAVVLALHPHPPPVGHDLEKVTRPTVKSPPPLLVWRNICAGRCLEMGSLRRPLSAGVDSTPRWTSELLRCSAKYFRMTTRRCLSSRVVLSRNCEESLAVIIGIAATLAANPVERMML